MRGRWAVGAMSGVLVGMLIGPSCRISAFVCASDVQCVLGDRVGRCEPNGFCAFPSGACASGWIYGEYGGDGLASQCVPVAAGSSEGSETSEGSEISETSGMAPSLDTTAGQGSGLTGSEDPLMPTTDTGSVVDDSWYDCQFAYRHRLGITGADTGVMLPGFVLLVVLSPDRLNTGMIADTGADLCFVGADDSTVLPREIERWDANGSSYIWVRLPELTGPTDSLWMYYGATGAVEPTCSSGTVWSDDVVGVWHLDSPVVDASPYANHPVVVTAEPLPGAIAGGYDFVDTTAFVEIPPADSLTGIFAGGGTITAWVLPTTNNGLSRIIERSNSSSGHDGWLFVIDNGYLGFRRGATIDNGSWRTLNEVDLDRWSHVAIVFNDDLPSPVPSFYIDGILQEVDEADALDGIPALDPTLQTTLGRAPVDLGSLEGALDELRLSTVPRSAAWIEHQWRSDTDMLLSYGPREAAPQSCSRNP